MSRPETLWVNDFDRTLLDTDSAYQLLVSTCEETGVVGEGELEIVRHETEASGGSFSPLDYLAQCGVRGAILSDLLERYGRSGQQMDLLYPDARRYLTALGEADQPAVILTYGNVAWQTAKLKAAGLINIPHIITDNAHKGQVIAGWQQRVGYRIQTWGHQLSGERVFLVDDKATSFTALPGDAAGAWIVRGEVLTRQQGDLPESVRRIKSLDELNVATD